MIGLRSIAVAHVALVISENGHVFLKIDYQLIFTLTPIIERATENDI